MITINATGDAQRSTSEQLAVMLLYEGDLAVLRQAVCALMAESPSPEAERLCLALKQATGVLSV